MLGAGETLVLFGGGGGLFDDASGPWCMPLLNGDADILISGSPTGFGLNNAGDTLVLTATDSNASVIVAQVGWTNGAAVDQSLVRSVDAPFAYVPYSTLAGALADRDATPGTPSDGTTFADVP